MKFSVLLVAALFSSGVLAQELSPEKAALIERDQKKEMDAIDKKYGNKKPSELTKDERKEVLAARSAAEQAVLEKHGTNAKEYGRYTNGQSRADRAATKAAAEALEKKDADAKKAADAKAAAPKAPGEIPIQRGSSDANPVILEEKEGGPPIVEKGLPQDAVDDQAAAAGAGATDSASEAAPPKK